MLFSRKTCRLLNWMNKDSNPTGGFFFDALRVKIGTGTRYLPFLFQSFFFCFLPCDGPLSTPKTAINRFFFTD